MASGGRHGPHLLEGPLLFRRARKIVAELGAAVWLAGEVARFIRTR